MDLRRLQTASGMNDEYASILVCLLNDLWNFQCGLLDSIIRIVIRIAKTKDNVINALEMKKEKLKHVKQKETVIHRMRRNFSCA